MQVERGHVSAWNEGSDANSRNGGGDEMDTVQQLGDYILDSAIDAGTTATIWKAHKDGSKTFCAIKRIMKKVAPPKFLEMVSNEVSVLERADDERVIELYEVIEDEESINVVQEYASGGDFYHQIAAHGPFYEREAQRLFLQIVQALQYVHVGLKVSHGDIKPDNIMFDNIRTRNIRLIDFGLAADISNSRIVFKHRGTPAYAAPEVVKYIGDGGYDAVKADVWSLGVVLFVMITGYLPFEDNSFVSLAEKIMNDPLEIPDEVSEAARDLLTLMLQKDPSKRLSLEQVSTHPWLRGQSSISSDLQHHEAPLGDSTYEWQRACWYDFTSGSEEEKVAPLPQIPRPKHPQTRSKARLLEKSLDSMPPMHTMSPLTYFAVAKEPTSFSLNNAAVPHPPRKAPLGTASSTAVESNAVTVHDARPQLSALEDMKATPCVPQSECSEQTHPAGDDDQVNHTKSHDRDRLTADGMDIEKNNEDSEDGGGAGYTAQSGSQVHTAVGLTPSTVKPPNYVSRPPQHVYDSLYEVEEEEEEEEIDGGGWYFG